MRLLRARIVAVIVALVPVGAAHAKAACQEMFLNGKMPVLLNQKLAARTTFICNRAYAILVSGIARDPLWSAEHLTAEGLAMAHDTPRRGQFHPDDRLPYEDQAQLSDYVRSGFDRGHMSPSGDMPTPEAQQESFSLANMVPQMGALDRGIWERIETVVRGLATQEGELFVVTGPAFTGGNLQILQDHVLVPSATWKAIYDPQTHAAGAWICTNVSQPECQTVSIATLSHSVGIDPFPGLSPAAKDAVMTMPAPADSPYRAGTRRHRHYHRSRAGWSDWEAP